MATLSREHRKELERVVIKARQIAETGARKALESLAVYHHEPWPSMTPEARKLRNRLRAHGRQLGDRRDQKRGIQSIDQLVQECAYEHWHRMLFARFLAESDLLIEPDTGIAISFDECRELAMEQRKDWLSLATEFAVRMLPQIFRVSDPVLEISFAPEIRHELERLLKSLPREVFLMDDSLGWVYQFWQTEKKDDVNKSERKIGAYELPAVTELFTEDYMVLFLLHNTLGAWWTAKRRAEGRDWRLSGYEWTYLRLADDGMPTAGDFTAWPRAARELKVLDPCMGSGHFLVFALPILVHFRMEEEGLSQEEAIDSVLRENLFGLEIDPRCTQIAAFYLALVAWRTVGYRPLPPLNLACAGLGIHAKEEDWLVLAGGDDRIEDGMKRLYQLFQQAPSLGSLINPRALGGNLLSPDFNELQPLLEQALEREKSDDTHELAVTAQGVAKAAEILATPFTLVATNVPYLGRGRQDDTLKKYCESAHPKAKADLATCFVERCLDFCSAGGSIALVTPQNWLFLGGYESLRVGLLRGKRWEFVARLGERGFESPQAAGAFTALISLSKSEAPDSHNFAAVDLADDPTPESKANSLRSRDFILLNQREQVQNPDSRMMFEKHKIVTSRLSDYAESFQGLVTGDLRRFIALFGEISDYPDVWEPFRTAIDSAAKNNGLASAIRWEKGKGELAEYARETREQLHDMHESGQRAWGKSAVAINRMRGLTSTLTHGEKFDNNVAVLVPNSPEFLPAILAFCTSDKFTPAVRALDHTLKVTNQTLRKVPFTVAEWQASAQEKYPNGLPECPLNDPTQWTFDGYARCSQQPLQVAIARLIGYRWPRQNGFGLNEYSAVDSDNLESYVDEDGVVCLEPLQRDVSAADRLRSILAIAYGDEWSPAKQAELLTNVTATSLDEWLREKFFDQHCRLFLNRPFIWHIWDGLKNGFHALMNYHRLAAPNGEGQRLLEKLIYSYVGEWIERQRADQRKGVEGADLRVAAAEHLKKELENILNGEPPYDLFVRWKPLHEQPIGWRPDLNDGVRINIRPFITARPLNAKSKNASILRVTPNIKWDKDRGREPHRDKQDFPWFWSWDQQTQDFPGGKTFDGNRWNNLHFTRAFKEEARKKKNEK